MSAVAIIGIDMYIYIYRVRFLKIERKSPKQHCFFSDNFLRYSYTLVYARDGDSKKRLLPKGGIKISANDDFFIRGSLLGRHNWLTSDRKDVWK